MLSYLQKYTYIETSIQRSAASLVNISFSDFFFYVNKIES